MFLVTQARVGVDLKRVVITEAQHKIQLDAASGFLQVCQILKNHQHLQATRFRTITLDEELNLTN